MVLCSSSLNFHSFFLWLVVGPHLLTGQVSLSSGLTYVLCYESDGKGAAPIEILKKQYLFQIQWAHNPQRFLDPFYVVFAFRGLYLFFSPSLVKDISSFLKARNSPIMNQATSGKLLARFHPTKILIYTLSLRIKEKMHISRISSLFHL